MWMPYYQLVASVPCVAGAQGIAARANLAQNQTLELGADPASFLLVCLKP